MATCANCIHHSLCDYNTNISGNGKVRLVYAEGADVKCSFFQNTADVVPKSEVDSLKAELEDRVYTINSLGEYLEKSKSEVERLEHILNCYALQYGTVTEQQEVIDKAKAEVVRDIFEEIEAEITAALKNNYARRNECNAETDLSHTANISGKIACLRGLADFVDELKKKYTGE